MKKYFYERKRLIFYSRSRDNSKTSILTAAPKPDGGSRKPATSSGSKNDIRSPSQKTAFLKFPYVTGRSDARSLYVIHHSREVFDPISKHQEVT